MATTNQEITAPSSGFVKGLGLTDSTTLVMGSMIGSGIFIVSSDVARQVRSPGLLILCWLLAAALTVIAALSYGELAAAMPHAGGQYVYLREAFGRLWGFLYGWTLFLVIQTGTIAAVAVAFAKFTGVFLPSISANHYLIGSGKLGLTTQQLLAIAVILAIAGLAWSYHLSGRLTNAEAQLSQAQQKLSLTGVTLRRDQQLYAQGFLSKQLLDNDTTQYETDRQAVSSAQAAVDSAAAGVRVNGNNSAGLQRENLASAQAAAASADAQADQIAVQIRKATIVSPVDGVVVNRTINPGQYPGSAPLFTVQEIDEVYAMLNASSDQIFALRSGAAADITVGALHLRHIRGVVEAVLGQAQPGGTNFVVKVRVPNPNGTLQSGMVVSASIAMPAVTGWMIPTRAFIDAAHDSVRVATSDGSTRVAAVRDLAEDGSHSIVEGLAPGSRVVLQE